MRLVAAALIAGYFLPGILSASAATCVQLEESRALTVKQTIALRRRLIMGMVDGGLASRCQMIPELVEVLNREVAIKKEMEAQRCAYSGAAAATVQGFIDRHKRELAEIQCP